MVEDYFEKNVEEIDTTSISNSIIEIEKPKIVLTGEYESKDIITFKACQTCDTNFVLCNVKINEDMTYELMLIEPMEEEDYMPMFPLLIPYWEKGEVVDLKENYFHLFSNKTSNYKVRNEQEILEVIDNKLKIVFNFGKVICYKKTLN
jgi:hypothetical protein